jgi:hypothetical protein
MQEIAMFGWLATRSSSLCRRAPQSIVSRRVRRIASGTLIHALPGLGSVLYVHEPSNAPLPRALPQGVLVMEEALTPLLDVRWLVAVSAVTDDGPREWCECVDLLGRTRARWHLLPDTDYLAWDALTAPCTVNIRLPPHAQPLRPDRASVVSFHLRELAGLLLLERNPTSLSPLGACVAGRIARAESALLQG